MGKLNTHPYRDPTHTTTHTAYFIPAPEEIKPGEVRWTKDHKQSVEILKEGKTSDFVVIIKWHGNFGFLFATITSEAIKESFPLQKVSWAG